MGTFSEAKAGDLVWCIVNGWSIIAKIADDYEYPIEVTFPGGESETYTIDGHKYAEDLNPTLFWDEVKIVPPARPRPLDYTI